MALTTRRVFAPDTGTERLQEVPTTTSQHGDEETSAVMAGEGYGSEMSVGAHVPLASGLDVPKARTSRLTARMYH